MTPTKDEIEAAMTPAGGWTRETLAAWGVDWPPKTGWKAALIAASEQESGSAKEPLLEQAIALRAFARNWTDLLSRRSVVRSTMGDDERRAMDGKVYIARQQFEAALDALLDRISAVQVSA